MQLAADIPTAIPSWLASVLAVLAVVATIITALMPGVVERIKHGRTRSEVAELPPVAERADKALDLIEDAMRDLRQQRDDTREENQRLRALLAEREAVLRMWGWWG